MDEHTVFLQESSGLLQELCKVLNKSTGVYAPVENLQKNCRSLIPKTMEHTVFLQENSAFQPESYRNPTVNLQVCLCGYMMERDQPVCVLICLNVYLGLQKQNLVTNKQKIADVVPRNHKNLTLLTKYCAETPLKLVQVIYDGNRSVSLCFDLFSVLMFILVSSAKNWSKTRKNSQFGPLNAVLSRL